MNALLIYAVLLAWGGGFCAPVGVLLQPVQAGPTLTIRTNDPEMTLMLDRETMPSKGTVRTFNIDHVQAGNWTYKASCIWKDGRQTFHEIPFVGGKSTEITLNDPGVAKGQVTQKPQPLAPDTVPPAFPLPPTGVNWDEIAKHERVVLHAGDREPVELNREMAGHLIENGLADDSHKWFLTFISSDEPARKRFLNDVATFPLLGHAKDNYHVHAYDVSDPMLVGLGFPVGVLLQDSTGKERAYSASYEGPEPLVGKLRNGDPNYKPGGSQPALPVSLPGLSAELLSGMAALFIVVAFIAGGLYLQRRGAK